MKDADEQGIVPKILCDAKAQKDMQERLDLYYEDIARSETIYPFGKILNYGEYKPNDYVRVFQSIALSSEDVQFQQECTRLRHALLPSFEVPSYEYFSNNRIIQSFKQFMDSKAPGPDGIKPILLKNLPPIFLTRLRRVYEAAYFTGYTPTAWKEAEVIFIPKPDKDDYSLAASFRPISLMSFVFKGMERLVYWHLLDTALAQRPLSSSQHGFRAGYWTETALTKVVSKLESAVYRGGTALAVFLDVQGAFDNVDPDKALHAMERRGFPPNMVQWYTSNLTTHLTTFRYKGLSLTRRTTRGVPQGGP